MNATHRRWIPKESTPVEHPDGLGIVYNYEQAGKLFGVAYIGKAGNSAWHFRFPNAEQRQQRIDLFFNGLTQSAQMKADRRAERTKPHTLTTGDIVINSWGWEQTNVDFYEVIKATKNFVELRNIGSQSVEGSTLAHGMADYVVANPEAKGENVTRHRADVNGYVNFKHGSGGKWDGKPHYRSWYA